MSRILPAALLIILGSTFALSAQEADPVLTGDIVNFVQLDLLGEQKVFKTEEGIREMQEYSSDLSDFYKEILYERYSYRPVATITTNLFTGGLGSLIIDDDYFWGSIIQGGMIASYTALIFAMTSSNIELRRTLYLSSEIGAAVFMVMGIAIPIYRMKQTNGDLKRALLIEE